MLPAATVAPRSAAPTLACAWVTTVLEVRTYSPLPEVAQRPSVSSMCFGMPKVAPHEAKTARWL